MSKFLTPNDTFRPSVYYANDDSIRMQIDVWADWKRNAQIAPWADGLLWPSSSFMSGDLSNALFGQDVAEMRRWASMSSEADASGGQQRLKIRGITRDSAGTALGSCLVQCFRTSDDLLVSESFSDSGGYFEAPTQYSGSAHYLVCYKGGSPDVAGTSVNTLMPS